MAGEVYYDLVQEYQTSITGTGSYTLGGAVTGYRTFASAVGTAGIVRYRAWSVDTSGNPNGTGWEIGLGTLSSSTTLARTSVTASSNSNNAVNWSAAKVYIALVVDAFATINELMFRGANGYRLTLTTAVPVTTADVTAASTVYWTPYQHNQVAIYSGTEWRFYYPGEIGTVLTNLTTATNYDMFVYDAGTSPAMTLNSQSTTGTTTGPPVVGPFTLTVTLPTNSTGDIMLMFLDLSTVIHSAPSGWTQLTTANNGHYEYCYYKTSGGSETNPSVRTVADAAAVKCYIVAIDNATIIDTSGTVTNTSTSVAVPSVTTTAANDLLFTFGYLAGGSSVTLSGGTQTQLQNTNNWYFGYETVTAAGATGTRTLTVSGSGANVAMNVAVRGLPSGVSLVWGPAWSSDTSRGTGAGTTELVMQDGVLVNKYALTSGPGALAGRYLGTIRTTGTNTTEDSEGGTTSQTGGKRFVWNYYNRVKRSTKVKDTTDSWTYTTATFRQQNNASGNKVEFVIGLNMDVVTSTCYMVSASTTSTTRFAGIGDGNATNIANVYGGGGSPTAATQGSALSMAVYSGYPSLGYHAFWPLEASNASGTTTWYGDAGLTLLQTGLIAEIFG